MKKPIPKPLKFTLDRTDGKSYVQQLTDAIRGAVSSGYYRNGDVLPSLEDLAATAGTSIIVPREALARLAKEGLVRPRRGVGSVVHVKRSDERLGHVVIATGETADNYRNQVVASHLSRGLLAAGYAVSKVSVLTLADGTRDWTQLDLVLRGTVSLVVVLGALTGVGRHVLSFGVPMVVEAGDPAGGPLVVGRLRDSWTDRISELAAHCRRAGVKSVCEVTFGAYAPQVAAQLAKAGVPAREWHVPLSSRKMTGPECVERAMYEAMVRRIRRGDLAEVYFFNDDYAARGALMACLAEGVRVPDDVKVVSWTVCGNRPVLPFSLTRIETDPVRAGEQYARGVLAMLGGERPAAAWSDDASRYVIGESFP